MKRKMLGAHPLLVLLFSLAILLASASGCGPCDLSGAETAECSNSDGTPDSTPAKNACADLPPQSLGALDGPISISGSVGSDCSPKELTFSIEENAALSLALERASASLTLTLARLEPLVEIDKVYPGPASDAFVKEAVRAGKYRVRVETSATSATYQLALDRVPRGVPNPIDPGDDASLALDLGELGSELRALDEYVGVTDPEDFYRFQLSENAVVTYTFQTDSFDGRAQLFENAAQLDEANGALRSISASQEPQTERLNLEAGVYFFRVAPRASSINYTLELSAEPYEALGDTPDRGDDVEDAVDVGVIGPSLVKVGGYVGPTDRADFYRLTISEAAALTFSVKSLVNSGRVRAQFYADAVQLNLSDPLHEIFTNGIDDYSECRAFEAGVYYVRFTPYSTADGALYTLLLSSSDRC